MWILQHDIRYSILTYPSTSAYLSVSCDSMKRSPFGIGSTYISLNMREDQFLKNIFVSTSAFFVSRVASFIVCSAPTHHSKFFSLWS